MQVSDYEKLGVFYLGKIQDLEQGRPRDEALLYDAKDLTTHAVCVGMTGSGKTGLCVSLIEEAAIDGIPALVVDLKGDLANLMLAFPEMRPEDFLPWIDPAEATRKGMSSAEFARDRARLWKDGLASWDQGLDRVRRYRDAVDIAIYTPGSRNGRPLTLLRSFAAPRDANLDSEALQERVGAAVAGLLGLVGIDADPLSSREYILLASIVQQAWSEGRDLDLGALIMAIQKPPFTKVGFFDLETFFPAGDRLALAMRINNLLASPGFASWLEGEPLDIARLLWTETGKPRISILSLAHLDDAGRMFFLGNLLNEVIGWMRGQPGSSSLRALLYIDEVFGYLPPSANPPAKKPMLTLLKQARAFGLGLVLATQNPVDIDYKALANAGTWLIGRLQTERDKLRVLDGLEGAAGTSGKGFDRARMDRILSGLSSRVFVMNNVHEDAPVVFHSRWALSYLRGPITGAQIRELMATTAEAPTAIRPQPEPTPLGTAVGAGSERDLPPAGIDERFILASARPRGGESLVYRPALHARARLHHVSAAAGVDSWTEERVFATLDAKAGADPWTEARRPGDLEFEPEAEPRAGFAPLPEAARAARSYADWKKALGAWLYREAGLLLWKCPTLKLTAKPGEREGDFRARVRALQTEKRDLAMEKLRAQYGRKLESLRGRIDRAEDKVAREEAQLDQQKGSTVISIGSTLLGALFGRKLGSMGNVGRAASSMRSAGRVAREKGDVARAKEDLAELEEQLRSLEAECAESLARLQEEFAGSEPELVELPIPPRKADTQILDYGLVWAPFIVDDAGLAKPAFDLAAETLSGSRAPRDG